MRFVTGDFTRLSAVVATQAKQWLDTGTGKLLDVTSPDECCSTAGWRTAPWHQCTSAPSRSPKWLSRGNLWPRGNVGRNGRDSPQLGRVLLMGRS